MNTFDDTLKFEILQKVLKFMKRENINICLKTQQQLLDINSKKFGYFLKMHSFGDFVENRQNFKMSTPTNYDVSCIENIIDRIPYISNRDDILDMSLKMYDKLILTSLIYEGETVVSLISVFLSFKRLKKKMSKKDFCEYSKLTSTPTLSKLLKTHSLNIRNLNIL